MKKLSRENTTSSSRHWLLQRITALGLLLLIPWPLWAIKQVSHLSYGQMHMLFKQPSFFMPFAVWLFITYWHAQMGLRVVLEDYIADVSIRKRMLWSSSIFFLLMAVLSIICLYSIIGRN